MFIQRWYLFSTGTKKPWRNAFQIATPNLQQTSGLPDIVKSHSKFSFSVLPNLYIFYMAKSIFFFRAVSMIDSLILAQKCPSTHKYTAWIDNNGWYVVGTIIIMAKITLLSSFLVSPIWVWIEWNGMLLPKSSTFATPLFWGCGHLLGANLVLNFGTCTIAFLTISVSFRRSTYNWHCVPNLEQY